MIYHNTCSNSQRSPTAKDKSCAIPVATINLQNAQSLGSLSTGKSIVMQPSHMPEETSHTYPHSSMAPHHPLCQVSSHPHPPHYPQYAQQPAVPCHHSNCSPVHRAWPSNYPAMHPPNWHHDTHMRSYESSSNSMTFGAHQGNQGSVNYVGIPNGDDCIPFDTYFPNDQPQGLGVLTPDQSPLALTSKVPEDHEYASSPPLKSESPLENGNDDHSALVQKVLVSSTPVMRSDGLKKKNAKFDIPKQRTIETIDSLINKEKDEGVIKELKAQKRLLKNREAALQSRQRKKQRAEDLEKQVMNLKDQLRRGSAFAEQLPHLTNGIAPRGHVDPIQKEIGALRQQNEQLAAEKAELMHAVALHNQEIAELRNKNERLMSQLQAKSDTPESTSLASSDYSDVVENLDHIHFDNTISYPDFSSEGNAPLPKHSIQMAGSTMSQIPPQLLTTLLLYGAHIASTTDHPNNDRRHIPVLSPDDRATSKEMLEALFAHANRVDQGRRVTSNMWRKPVDLIELARAYPRIVADLKSMFEAPDASQGNFLMPFNV